MTRHRITSAVWSIDSADCESSIGKGIYWTSAKSLGWPKGIYPAYVTLVTGKSSVTLERTAWTYRNEQFDIDCTYSTADGACTLRLRG